MKFALIQLKEIIVEYIVESATNTAYAPSLSYVNICI